MSDLFEILSPRLQKIQEIDKLADSLVRGGSIAASGLAALATGEWAFTGSAGLEVEMLDSVSGVRLAAAVDRRTGGKITGKVDKFSGWWTIKNSLDFWANQMRERLAEARAGNAGLPAAAE